MLNGNAVREALKGAALVASRDATLPLLGMVKLETVGDELVVQATDRYQMVEVRVPCETYDGIDAVWLPHAAATAMARSLGARPGSVPMRVDTSGTDMLVRLGDAVAVGVSADRLPAEWPRSLDKILEPDGADGVPYLALSPAVLATFAKLPRERNTAAWLRTPDRDGRVARSHWTFYGAAWRYAVMTMRGSQD